MRMLGRLKTPSAGPGAAFHKVMLHETAEGVYAYLYTSPEALFCACDLCYSSLSDALEEWDSAVTGWTELEDPLPHCQHDCPLPVRVKGREKGAPQWGRYEILENGEWKDFTP